MSPPRIPAFIIVTLAAALGLAVSDGGRKGGPAADCLKGDFACRAKKTIREAKLGRAKVGFLAVEAESGRTLCGHEEGELLNPASNVKIVTTAAGLFHMRPHYTFATEVYAERPVEKGETEGSLYVKGHGDPFLVTEEIVALGELLLSSGLRSVKGGIVIDQSYFDEKKYGAGYDQEKSDRAYLAPVTATAVNFNTLTLRVSPAEEEGKPPIALFEPPSSYFKIDNRAVTVGGGRTKLVASSVPDGARSKVLLKGRIALGADSKWIYRKIEDPSLNAGAIMKEIFGALGVKVAGAASSGKAPDGAALIETHYSPALAVLVRKINKHSSNFMAEMLLKATGAAVEGEPGTWEKGLRAASRFLEGEVGIKPGSYAMVNGSGLNEGNLFSAEQIVRVLRHMWGRFDVGPEFVSSLAVLSADGTIRKRLKGTGASEKVRAKTGLLKGVAALSGYAMSKGGKVIVFSAMANGVKGGTEKARVMFDKLVALMVEYEGRVEGGAGEGKK